MHLATDLIPEAYRQYTRRKVVFIIVTLALLVAALVLSLCLGSSTLSPADVFRSLLRQDVPLKVNMVVWKIRLPQALTAIVAGAGLAASGTVMQSVLRNPLGSPFTLGISHAAAFGAALSVLFFQHPCATPLAALFFSVVVAILMIAITRYCGATPEMMVLSGVALGSLFTAGTMVLQFFADDTELASMVFWTFGDTARANNIELAIMAGTTFVCVLYFMCNSWNYNAIETGDDTARGLGIRVGWVRTGGMLAASLLAAVLIAFIGIIGFVGLIVPHITRRMIGADHRYLLPASLLAGGLLLLASDTAARLLLAPHTLPVSILTAFLGAPVFFWLILWRRHS